MELLKKYRFRKLYLILALLIAGIIYYIITTVPFGTYEYKPGKGAYTLVSLKHRVPLDPTSPWPKFRANELQNGRSSVAPRMNTTLRPWVFRTGKGVFSSPVVDAEDNVYIGSADHSFYAIGANGVLKWRFVSGEVIDSSALLDDRGRVYFGSGDACVYCLKRENGELVWRYKAHTVHEVEEQFGIKTYNLDWFEGNIAMLDDGSIIAPNDNYLIYAIDRESGKSSTQYLGNELMWSLPAVNPRTGRIFFGSQYMALKNVFCYESSTGRRLWTNGGLGSNAASPLLTSAAKMGAIILGGFDGYIRAYAQDNGKLLWKRGLRDHIYASPAQLSDGIIIQPSTDGTVYALKHNTGEILWAFDTLEPIRSSPAVDSLDRIYVGSGEGRLFCINPDGSLRWAYRCIDEDRNDMNSSPALGSLGVYIGGENGGVFFVPYEYPLSAAGRNDSRCTPGPGEDLPAEGAFLVYTTRFGKLLLDPPKRIDANQPLAFTLFVRRKGDTVKSLIDRESLTLKLTGDPKTRVDVSANRQFVVITPQESWTGPEGGTLTVNMKGKYLVDMRRFGLKFFGGTHGGSFETSLRFVVPPRRHAPLPYRIPEKPGGTSTVFEMSRLAAPNPTMLPSWNQIGFDSLHYLGGLVEKNGNEIIVWVIGGKLHNGKTVVNPLLEARFPLTLVYDRGLLTLRNYEGFKVNFVGSWDMPFGFYRIAAKANPLTGAPLESPALGAIALCDDIEYYGRFLKLMGMSEFDSGHMAVFGGMNMRLHGSGFIHAPAGAGAVSFHAGKEMVSAEISGGELKKGEHVFSILLVDSATGKALPLYYTKHTTVEADAEGKVKKVSVKFNKENARGRLRAYYMVDTYSAARGEIEL